LLEDKVPQFRRVDYGMVLGLRMGLEAGLVVDDLNQLLGVKTYFGDPTRNPALVKKDKEKAENFPRYYTWGTKIQLRSTQQF
jgi:hypothetical protein